MSKIEITGKKCDCCKVVETDRTKLEAWTKVRAVIDEIGEYSTIIFPNGKQLEIKDCDFCSRSCFMQWIEGRIDVP